MKLGTVAVMPAGAVCFASLFLNTRPAAAQASPERLVRIAELEIDPGQLEAYKHALREEIEASIRIEASRPERAKWRDLQFGFSGSTTVDSVRPVFGESQPWPLVECSAIGIPGTLRSK